MEVSSKRGAACDAEADAPVKMPRADPDAADEDTPPAAAAAQPDKGQQEDDGAPTAGPLETQIADMQNTIRTRLIAWLNDFSEGVAKEAQGVLAPRMRRADSLR